MALPGLFISLQDHFWSFLIDHLWQSTFFALLVLAAIVLLRQAPPRIRYVLYIAMSLKFLIPTYVFVLIAKSIGFDASSFFINMAYNTRDPLLFVTRQQGVFHVTEVLNFEKLQPYQPFFLMGIAVWALGSAFFFGVWMKRRYHIFSEIRRGQKILNGRVWNMLASAKSRAGIGRKIGLITSPTFTEIGVWGSLHPQILLPDHIAEHLTDSELEAILLHELIHVSRWDNLISDLQMGICCLFWFHPLVWLADRKMLSERERICDAQVLEMGSASRTYAASLIKVLRFGLGFRMAGVSCAGGSNLKQRIEQISTGDLRHRASLVHHLAVGAVLATLLVLSVAAVPIDTCTLELQRKFTRKPAVVKPNCTKTAGNVMAGWN